MSMLSNIRGRRLPHLKLASLLLATAWSTGCGESGTEPGENGMPAAVGVIPAEAVTAGGPGPRSATTRPESPPSRRVGLRPSFTVDVGPYFADPDGDRLAFSATSSDPSVARASAAGGTVAVTVAGAGAATITVIATDPGGLAARQTFRIQVAGGVRGSTRTVQAAAAAVSARTYGTGETIATLPTGLWMPDAIDGATFVIVITPGTLAAGGHVTIFFERNGYIVKDGVRYTCVTAGGCRIDARTVGQGSIQSTGGGDGTNRAPETVGTIPGRTMTAGQSATLDVSSYFRDPDGDRLTYSASSSSSGVARASVSGSSVRIEAVGQGTATVRITATDPGGLTARQSFAVTVQGGGGGGAGGSFGSAIPLAMGDSASGAVQSGGELYYEIDVPPETGRQAVRLTVWTEGTSDTQGRLYGADTLEIGRDDDGGPATNFLIAHEGGPGKYYVKVQGFGGAAARYALKADDHGDGPETATRVAPGAGETPGRLHVAGNVDYFRIAATASARRIVAETTGSTDTYGQLLDGDGNVVTQNDDGGQGSNFKIDREVDPGTYYIRVTGFQNRETGPYVLAVAATRDAAPSSDATLDSLSLSGVEAADLGFDPARMRYAVSVANDVEETTVAARASEGATAVITPNDADGDDSNGHQVALAVGDTEIRVVVTAPGGKRADYVITVTRAAPPATPQVTLVLDPASVSENGGVSRITATVDPVSAAAFDVAVSAMAVDPAVAGDFILSNNMTLSFAANEASSSGAVSITAVNNNDYADDKTVKVSGSVSSTDVTEPDDVDLTIREDDVKPPAEATLSSLSLSGVEAADLGFDPATMTYAVSVANEVEETTVDAMASEGATVTAITPADADAAMAGHQVALAVGDTDITVVVTAPGGKRADYEITVTRMKSSDASLSSVTVNGDAVTADADGNYAHDVANGVTEATVVAMAVEGASVSYDPSDGDDSDGSMIDLDVGPNMVTVTVTAANDSTMDYTVTVNRAASSDVSLAHFTVGTDTITADEDDGTYTHETSGEQVTVSAMAGHDSATAMITDPVDADDDEDGHQVDIAVGDTEITATVTAEDGTSTATYTLTITRDATAGISVSMEEFDLPEGDTTTYRVSLATMPTTSVTVGIVAAGGLTIDKSSLVFAPENYHVAQIVRVIADENDSGAGAFEDAELDLTHTVTAGPDSYFGDTPKSKVVTVNVENDDAEGAAATLVPTTLTIEEGKTDSIGVTLGDPDGSATDGKPLGNVTVTIEAADTSRAREVRLSRSSLRFTPDNFRDTLYVRVTAVDNDIDNGASNVDDVVLAFEASGGGYDDLVGEITGGVTVSIEDDDTAAIMVTDLTGRQVREGGTLSYDVKLGSQPEGRVSILVDGGTTHNAAFTFDHTNWSQAQSRTITVPQDDNEADETVTLTFSQSGYVDLAGDPPAFTVKDNDGDAGAVIVSHTAMSIAAGGSDTYTLSLTQAPAVGETFKVTIGSLGQINIDPLGEVEFNRSNWNTGVRVTLSPLGQASGSISVTNAAAASTGGDDDDAKYRAGTDGTSVTVTIPDSS